MAPAPPCSMCFPSRTQTGSASLLLIRGACTPRAHSTDGNPIHPLISTASRMLPKHQWNPAGGAIILKAFISEAVRPFFLDDHPVSPYIQPSEGELPVLLAGVEGLALPFALIPLVVVPGCLWIESRAQPAQGGGEIRSKFWSWHWCLVTWAQHSSPACHLTIPCGN